MKLLPIICYVLLAGSIGLMAQDEIEDDSETTVPYVKPDWRSRNQNEDGSWGETPKWFKGNGHPGYTALMVITYLEQGETPMSERYGQSIQKGMRWLAEYGLRDDLKTMLSQNPNSAAAKSHALMVMALASSHGMTMIPFLKTSMEKCLAILIDAQLPGGGFAPGLDPNGKWDTALSIWCIRALATAKWGGTENPKLKNALARALIFLNTTSRSADGGFAPSQDKAGEADESLIVAGTYLSYLLGRKYPPPEQTKRAIKRINSVELQMLIKARASVAHWKTVSVRDMESWYWASKFMDHARRFDKLSYRNWRSATDDAVRAMPDDWRWTTRSGDGFEAGDGDGDVAATALGIFALSFPIRHLPTFDPEYIEEEDVDAGGLVIEID